MIAAVNFTDGTKETIWKEGNSELNQLTTQVKSGSNAYYTLTSPVAVDSDSDGYLDLIYAGDTEGGLWKFYYDYNDTLWRKVKLFDTGGQPITGRPTLVFDDQQNLRIFFGTGKYLVGQDKDDTTWNGYYCIIEKKFVAKLPMDLNGGHYTVAPAAPLQPGDLADITLFRTEGELSDYLSGLTEAEQQAFNDKRDGVGWYFNLDDPAGDPMRTFVATEGMPDCTQWITRQASLPPQVTSPPCRLTVVAISQKDTRNWASVFLRNLSSTGISAPGCPASWCRRVILPFMLRP